VVASGVWGKKTPGANSAGALTRLLKPPLDSQATFSKLEGRAIPPYLPWVFYVTAH